MSGNELQPDIPPTCGCGREREHDQPWNWRCAMGAVSVPPGTELPEVTIRRMRDAEALQVDDMQQQASANRE